MTHTFFNFMTDQSSQRSLKTIIKFGAIISIAVAATACSDHQSRENAEPEPTDTQPQTLRIAAAANLSEVLPKIVADYQLDHKDTDIELSFASSGKLYAQIEAGAPYDVFLSANQSYPAKLALRPEATDNANNGQVSHAPFTYTQGQLTFYSVTHAIKGATPLNNFTLDDLSALLAAPSNSKVTIANPALAPYGEAAKSYLTAQQLYAPLETQKRLIQSENIGQAFQYVHTGNVDYGFVAQSQVSAIDAPSEQFFILPADSYPAILQDGLQLTDTQAATDFVTYLRAPAAQSHFEQAGYLTAPAAP